MEKFPPEFSIYVYGNANFYSLEILMDNILKEFWNETSGLSPSRQLQKTIPSLTQNTLLHFIQQWYKKHEEPLSISGKNLCKLLCMSKNQLRLAIKLLEKNGYIKTKLVGHPSINCYLLSEQSNEIRPTTQDLEEPDLEISREPKTPRRKVRNSEKKPVYPSSEISDNILTTILNKDKLLSELLGQGKYLKLYEKFGTKIELDLSCLLYEEIIKNRPGYFDWKLHSDKCAIVKIILNWCEDIDKLIRIDKREPDLVLDVITWCQQDSFWAQNVKSAETLRKQFPKLHERMDEDKPGATTVCRTRDMHPEITQKLIKQYTRDFLAGRETQWEAKDKEKFIKAARILVKFAHDGKLRQENVPGYLMRCLYLNYTEEEKAVLPGHLCSKRTWDVLMPQYLRELGVIYSA